MFRLDDFRIILVAVLFLVAALSVAEAKPTQCSDRPVYCKLTKFRPDLDRLTLSRIASVFRRHAEKHGQDPMLSVAIAMQETGLRQVNRIENVIVFNPDGITWRVERGVTDVCMFQFHVDTIVDQGLDPIKLKDNLDYCVEQHFKLLKKKRTICSDLGDDAWTCYHSKNPKLRKTYKRMVARYF
jgi:hypothetical protein